MRKSSKLTTGAVVLLTMLVLQLLGAFSGLNSAINSMIPLLEGPVAWLTYLGGDLFLGVFIALVLFYDWRERHLSRKTLAFLISTLLGLIIVALMKVVFAEPRPRPLPGANYLSEGAFPSGHTFRAAAIASYASDRWGSRLVRVISWIYAIGVGITRLLLHYHWFSDVLFSLAFAPWLYGVSKAVLGVNE